MFEDMGQTVMDAIIIKPVDIYRVTASSLKKWHFEEFLKCPPSHTNSNTLQLCKGATPGGGWHTQTPRT